MGLDGGTIPTRGELVQVKKKPEQKDKESDTQHKWNNCTITQLPFEMPIVVCHLGMLFNKSSILEFLLGKLNLEKCANFQHIEMLRDVRELQLTNNRAQTATSSAFICPVTGLEMNGKHRFVCLWKCGCVISEKAMKKAPSTSCHKCGMEYKMEDIVNINPNDADFETLRLRMAQRKSEKILVSNHKPHSSTVPYTLAIQGKERLHSNEEYSDPKPNTSDSQSRTVSKSLCLVTSLKRTHSPELSIEKHKSKKSKKEHKHKKDKYKSSADEKPKLHAGWEGILSNQSRRW